MISPSLVVQPTGGGSRAGDAALQVRVQELQQQVTELQGDLTRRVEAYTKLDVEIKKRGGDSRETEQKIRDQEEMIGVSGRAGGGGTRG